MLYLKEKLAALEAKKTLTPEEGVLMLAYERGMNREQFVAFLTERAIDEGLCDEDDGSIAEMPETDLLEWIDENELLD